MKEIDEKLIKTFKGIVGRCNNLHNSGYYKYGLRGIKCEWRTFLEFKNDMMENCAQHCRIHGYKNTTIERIDNDKNYCKNNCRWATYVEQSNNRRNNHYIVYKGIKKTMQEWSRIKNINYSTLRDRLNYGGWEVNRAIETITRHKKYGKQA